MTQKELDERFMRRAFQIARDAVAHGNHPFGALVVDRDQNVIEEAENNVLTAFDTTGHAELNLVRKISQIPPEERRELILYTSTEPCVMCAGAICWSHIGRVVFGCTVEALGQLAGNYLPVKTVAITAHCADEIIVDGPVLLEEAIAVHGDFWQTHHDSLVK